MTKTNNATISLFGVAVALIGMSAVGERSVTFVESVLVPHSCAGCAATAKEDKDLGIVNGAQVIALSPGFTLSGSVVGMSAACVPGEANPGPGLICVPTDVCKFTGHYLANGSSAVGPFHDDFIWPCRWSMTSDPYGAQSLHDSVTWTASCSDAESWYNVRFFKNAVPGDCNTGVLAGEIKLIGVCTACTGSPY